MSNELNRRAVVLWTAGVAVKPGLAWAAAMKLPLQIPYAAERPGTRVDLEIDVVREGPYWFTLRFPYKDGDQNDLARVRTLTGDRVRDASGNIIPSGIPLRIRLVVDGPGLVAGSYDKVFNPTLASYGSGFVTKMIDSVYLKQGTYRVIVESLLRAPDLDASGIQFAIGRDPKAA